MVTGPTSTSVTPSRIGREAARRNRSGAGPSTQVSDPPPAQAFPPT